MKTPVRKDRSRRHIVVVGNQFLDFAEVHEYAITYSTFESSGIDRAQDETTYHLGQGLTQKQRERIARCIAGRSASTVVGFPELASRRETHKHEERNILVSRPRKLSPKLFELDLLIDGRCADLSDHQTGQHISGMTLVEAGRQAFLAVTERYFIPEGESGDYFFVTRGKQADFCSFAFPLPAILRYEILDSQIDDRDRLLFNVLTTVFQASQVIAELHYSFTAYRKQPLLKKEHEKAAGALEAFFQNRLTVPSSAAKSGTSRKVTRKIMEATAKAAIGDSRDEEVAS